MGSSRVGGCRVHVRVRIQASIRALGGLEGLGVSGFGGSPKPLGLGFRVWGTLSPKPWTQVQSSLVIGMRLKRLGRFDWMCRHPSPLIAYLPVRHSVSFKP